MNQDLVATAKQCRALTGKLESLNSGTLGGKRVCIRNQWTYSYRLSLIVVNLFCGKLLMHKNILSYYDTFGILICLDCRDMHAV